MEEFDFSFKARDERLVRNFSPDAVLEVIEAHNRESGHRIVEGPKSEDGVTVVKCEYAAPKFLRLLFLNMPQTVEWKLHPGNGSTLIQIHFGWFAWFRARFISLLGCTLAVPSVIFWLHSLGHHIAPNDPVVYNVVLGVFLSSVVLIFYGSRVNGLMKFSDEFYRTLRSHAPQREVQFAEVLKHPVRRLGFAWVCAGVLFFLAWRGYSDILKAYYETSGLGILCAVILVLTTLYVVWDWQQYMHSGKQILMRQGVYLSIALTTYYLPFFTMVHYADNVALGLEGDQWVKGVLLAAGVVIIWFATSALLIYKAIAISPAVDRYLKHFRELLAIPSLKTGLLRHPGQVNQWVFVLWGFCAILNGFGYYVSWNAGALAITGKGWNSFAGDTSRLLVWLVDIGGRMGFQNPDVVVVWLLWIYLLPISLILVGLVFRFNRLIVQKVAAKRFLAENEKFVTKLTRRVCLSLGVTPPIAIRVMKERKDEDGNEIDDIFAYVSIGRTLTLSPGAIKCLGKQNGRELAVVLAHESYHLKRHWLILLACRIFSEITLFGHGGLLATQDSFAWEFAADDQAIRYCDKSKPKISREFYKEVLCKIRDMNSASKIDGRHTALAMAAPYMPTPEIEQIEEEVLRSWWEMFLRSYRLFVEFHFGDDGRVYFHPSVDDRIARIENLPAQGGRPRPSSSG